MKKIIQLSDICITLEEAQSLNNTNPSAIAWVLNPYKNFVEFELKPVEKMTVENKTTEGLIGFRIKEGGAWEIWQTEEFVSMEQIEILIKEGKFYYAPLKNKIHG